MRDDRPSSTATLIAAATVYLARDPHLSDLVPAGAADLCARCLESCSPGRLKAVLALSSKPWRWVSRLAERALVPGLLLHFMLRKRWIEDSVRTSLDHGCEQVIVIAAGFDSLAQRLCVPYPRARFIEIDHPATQRFKRRAIEHEQLPSNLELIAADLARDSLQKALSDSKLFRSDVHATFIIEGLLMYLPDDVVADLFRALTHAHSASMRVIFTVMEPTPDGRSAFHDATPLVRWLLSVWSEPFRSFLRRDEAARFLGGLGFELADVAASETLRARYLEPSGRQHLPLARGEMIVVAERAGCR